MTFTPRARLSELNEPYAVSDSDSHSNVSKKQANAFAVPFCFTWHGLLSKSVSKDEDDITALYIVVKQSLGPCHNAALDAAIASNRAGFTLNRASYGSALNMYYAASSGIAREVLHVIFFVLRGAPSHVIKEDSRARVDTIHAVLGLAKGKALIRQGHPLLGQYIRLLPVTPSASFLWNAKGLRLLCNLCPTPTLSLSSFNS